VVAARCEVADNILSRGLGLIGRSGLAAGEGLLLTKTGSITMVFMRFPIDALFLDRAMRVLRVAQDLHPWVPAVGAPRGTDRVLELPSGTAARTGTQAGDELILSESTGR
jgi:uncharacterized membrane protein (UPF0127 family)